ncbi:hypothetical protein PQQ88_33490, partial [Paraburkholderia caledonica]|uniref:hypothetical protein n=1 Tax=Paraburkholderia caledonica TaxID=134536 RepID=UPI0038BC6CED
MEGLGADKSKFPVWGRKRTAKKVGAAAESPLGSVVPVAEATAQRAREADCLDDLYALELVEALSGYQVSHVRWRGEEIKIALSRSPFSSRGHQLRCALPSAFS